MRNAHRNSACTWLQQHQQKVACKWNMQRATNHHHLPHQGLHRHHPHHLIQKLDFSSLLSLLHFPVIIPSIMHKLTRISIPTVTSLFVILTYVRLIIKSCWNSYVSRSPQSIILMLQKIYTNKEKQIKHKWTENK